MRNATPGTMSARRRGQPQRAPAPEAGQQKADGERRDGGAAAAVSQQHMGKRGPQHDEHVRPVMPTSEAACARPPMPSAIRPGAAQGKPVNRWPRSHSAMPSAAARASASVKPAAAQPSCRHGGKPPVDRHAARQRAQHEGHHPEIGGGIDEEGKTDPVEGHGEIAEPEQPAGAEAAAPAGWLSGFEQQRGTAERPRRPGAIRRAAAGRARPARRRRRPGRRAPGAAGQPCGRSIESCGSDYRRGPCSLIEIASVFGENAR